MIFAHTELPPRQRSARNDPAMRDGDSGHGNPGDSAGDLFEVDSDTDVGDTRELETISGEDEPLSGADRESLRGFRELREEVKDNDRYSDDAAVDATMLSQEREALGDTKEDDGGVVQGENLTAALPMVGYDSLTAKQIGERARELPSADVTRLLDHEKANRNRKSLVAQLERIATGRVRGQREKTSK